MKNLNLGCGNRFHPAWVNVDFVSTAKEVMAHNLLTGIPFADNDFDAVYHSHVLEHFTKSDAPRFIRECYRVLKKGGVIRIAVPDLERIVRCYLEQLEKSLAGDREAQSNYEWMMLEMYDQTVRNKSGGDMLMYFNRKEIANEDFIYGRIGEEGRQLRNFFLNSTGAKEIEFKPILVWKRLISPGTYIHKIKLFLSPGKKKYIRENKDAIDIGKFRLGGEIHQWMYDRYSLRKLLEDCGFKDVQIKTPFESSINEWEKYQLESKDGIVFKPDSLFMEAVK